MTRLYLLFGFFISTLLACVPALQAQEVYRCGNSYSQGRCASGTVVPVEDARTPQQKADSARVVQRNTKLANALEQQRHRQEAVRAATVRAQKTARRTHAKARGKNKNRNKTKVKPAPKHFTARVIQPAKAHNATQHPRVKKHPLKINPEPRPAPAP